MDWTIKTLPVHGFAANTYWLESKNSVWLVDPAANPPDSESVLRLNGIIVTHGHMDHLLAADLWRKGGQAALYIHTDDAVMLTDSRANVSSVFRQPLTWQPAEVLLKDQDQLDLTDGWMTVIHTPGHTKGGICLLLKNKENSPLALFTGDTLFADDVGRTDLAGGSESVLMESLVRLRSLLQGIPKTTPVYSGHGPATTAGEVLQNNYWLRNA